MKFITLFLRVQFSGIHYIDIGLQSHFGFLWTFRIIHPQNIRTAEERDPDVLKYAHLAVRT